MKRADVRAAAQSAAFRRSDGVRKGQRTRFVRRNLFRLAINGNLGANIFLAKNLLGYKDVVANEHTGPEGGPIQMSLADVLRERKKAATR
jgi:hypothetical protein